MRISKPTERWFPFIDDPDEGSVLIEHLSPGDTQDIYDETMPQNIEYEQDDKGNMVPVFKTDMDRKAQREKTLVACIKDWKNHFDEQGEPIECNPENIIRASRGIEGYNEFITECRNTLAEDIEKRKGSAGKKLIEFCDWIVVKQPHCGDCRALAAHYNDIIDCSKCIPYLLMENRPIMDVYNRVCGQHIMGDSMPVDLNLMPVFKIMDLVGIKEEDRLSCIDLVKKAYHYILQKNKDKK